MIKVTLYLYILLIFYSTIVHNIAMLTKNCSLWSCISYTCLDEYSGNAVEYSCSGSDLLTRRRWVFLTGPLSTCSLMFVAALSTSLTSGEYKTPFKEFPHLQAIIQIYW